MLTKLQRSKFDETVELHINTVETGLSGNITLPHGTGKTIRVAIADDDLLAKVALGKIEFDILLAAPQMMSKLARVAKILGPKGLMPNPKNATLVKDPEKAAQEFKKGQINFRTELKAPIMHLIVGKMSFGATKLAEGNRKRKNPQRHSQIHYEPGDQARFRPLIPSQVFPLHLHTKVLAKTFSAKKDP